MKYSERITNFREYFQQRPEELSLILQKTRYLNALKIAVLLKDTKLLQEMSSKDTKNARTSQGVIFSENDEDEIEAVLREFPNWQREKLENISSINDLIIKTLKVFIEKTNKKLEQEMRQEVKPEKKKKEIQKKETKKKVIKKKKIATVPPSEEELERRYKAGKLMFSPKELDALSQALEKRGIRIIF